MIITVRPASDPQQAVRRGISLWETGPLPTPPEVQQIAIEYYAAVARSREAVRPAPVGDSVLERAEHAVNAEAVEREARAIAEADLKSACRDLRDRLRGASDERLIVDEVNRLFAQADRAAEELPHPLPEDSLANGWSRDVLQYLQKAPRRVVGALKDIDADIREALRFRDLLVSAGFLSCNAEVHGVGGGFAAWPLVATPSTPPMPRGDGRRMPEALGLVGHRITHGAEAVRAVTSAEAAEEWPGELVPPFYPRWGG